MNFGERPTAIVCPYDNNAFGVIRYLNEQGYSVPGKLIIRETTDKPKST
ncbi:MAG: substrate-binding domain-containing protein [Lachnospiraceae bacterium]|nr:substrate-binding domain-containing protein [Lachnospiraceae bacterium]